MVRSAYLPSEQSPSAPSGGTITYRDTMRRMQGINHTEADIRRCTDCGAHTSSTRPRCGNCRRRARLERLETALDGAHNRAELEAVVA